MNPISKSRWRFRFSLRTLMLFTLIVGVGSGWTVQFLRQQELERLLVQIERFPDELRLRENVCIRNDDYPASLELSKVYRVLSDADAAEHHLLRVIDESGEDYLYPDDRFVMIELPRAAVAVVSGKQAKVARPRASRKKTVTRH